MPNIFGKLQQIKSTFIIYGGGTRYLSPPPSPSTNIIRSDLDMRRCIVTKRKSQVLQLLGLHLLLREHLCAREHAAEVTRTRTLVHLVVHLPKKDGRRDTPDD